MAIGSNETIEIVEKFLKLIKDAGIHLERAILFGSHAKGNAGEWSDIDIALVSPDFLGISFYDSKKLIPFLLKVDSRIELHPFRPEDFAEDNEFIREIMRNGVDLKT